MVTIGILSDTHSFFHPRIRAFFETCDEIWHAGDIGDLRTADELQLFKPLRAVYGNIDGNPLRKIFQPDLVFVVENVKVAMMHIGGYPGRYDRKAEELIAREKPGLFVTGHSHILKVIYDKKHDLLFVNPGAAGNFGFHRSITAIRMIIDDGQMRDLEILDLPRGTLDRGK